MEPPVVSVAMVVCNMQRFIGESMESILNQSFRDFEFVIVDFGSTDNSRAIISGYQAKDSRIKLHVIPPCGLSEARNASCFLAQGKYIALMDADDVAFPDRLERQVAFLDQHAEIALLGSAIRCMGASGEAPFVRSFPLTDGEVRSALERGVVLQQTTVMMRREAFGVVKGYRRAFPLAEDYDLWLRVIEHFQVANLPEPLVDYRIHPGQISVQRLRQEVMCWIAARAAAQIRAKGGVDPLWEIEEITPETLTLLGVTQTAFAQALATAYFDWMNAMLQVRNDDAVLQLVADLRELSRSAKIDRFLLSEACLNVAQIQFKRGSYLAGLGSTARAVCTRPVIAGRPVKKLLKRAVDVIARRNPGKAAPARVGTAHDGLR
jgi:glycosyltransferase involved in cell wall biosynthesis